MRRYNRAPVIALGTQYGTSESIVAIRNGLKQGTIGFTTRVLTEHERLDTIAGKVYGDGRLWWVLAAASNIGYSCQVPPGTIITVPQLQDVARLTG